MKNTHMDPSLEDCACACGLAASTELTSHDIPPSMIGIANREPGAQHAIIPATIGVEMGGGNASTTVGQGS